MPLPHTEYTPPDASGSAGRVSTMLVSNLHCSSCVRTIEESLASLTPAPTDVHVSIVAQLVTFRHPPDLPMSTVKAALDDAGFDLVEDSLPTLPTPAMTRMTVTRTMASRMPSFMSRRKQEKHAEQCILCGGGHEEDKHKDRRASTAATVTSQSTLVPEKLVEPSPTLSKVPEHAANVSSHFSPDEGPLLLSLSIGGMTCSACSSTITNATKQLPGVSNVAVDLIGNSGTFTISSRNIVDKIVETIEDSGYEAEIDQVRPLVKPTPQPAKRGNEVDGPYHLSLSVGGMTCASCTSAITEALSKLDGVSEVVVNLLGNSASVKIDRSELVAIVVETIEDIGYEAEVDAKEPSRESKHDTPLGGPREMALHIDGMFCKHCPGKVKNALEPYIARGQITVLEGPTLENPIIKISYTPNAPRFTIRDIIRTIASSKGDTPFSVSIYKPPTLEERTRRMYAHEQRALLLRLIFCVIIAIPTFIIGIVFMTLLPHGAPLRDWAMRPLWGGNAARAQWALFFLATPAMFYSAGLFHRRAIKELRALWRRGNPTPVWKRLVRFGSMNLLVSAGVSVAYFASIVLLGLAASQAPSEMGMGDDTTYFDSVVFLTMFLLIGRYLEAYSKGRTADAITALGKLRPNTALVLAPADIEFETPPSSPSNSDRDVEKDAADTPGPVGMRVQKIGAELLEVGDIVRVLHGSTPPADGTVISLKGDEGAGEALTLFDESSLTGESKPVKKAAGDKVYLGTVNQGNVIDVRVDSVGGESMLDHIVRVVREGQTKRAPIERVADMVTAYFVPVITLIAVLTWVIWLALGYGGALPKDYLDVDVGGWAVWSLEFAIAVFVVACPCGIGLAAPTALLVGSGLAAKYGILARGGGEAFQEAAQLDLVIFDKTGTLTEGGDPKVTDIEVFSPFIRGEASSPETILGIALEIESASGHPLASAIRKHCEGNGAAHVVGSEFSETPGRGLKARFAELGCTAVIGNEIWMDTHRVKIDGVVSGKLERWKSEGKSVILLAIRDEKNIDGAYDLGAIFAVADPVRGEAKPVLARLQGQGITTWMISGDNATTAKAVARMVGIPETNVIAGVLPHEKAAKVQWLQQVGPKRLPPKWRRVFGKNESRDRCIVAMIGDGINDAPALTTADVGIAIGSGSDVAISSAAFILVSSNLRSLLVLCDLSRKVLTRVKMNFLWACMYNIAALPIAAGVIYPAGHARLDPVWASLAMALSSVTVVCSSLALKLYKEPRLNF